MKTPPTQHEPANSPPGSLAGKYLTFRLGGESFGVNVLQIREIIRLAPVTAIPGLPDAVKGVINLRGKVITIVDLRARFGLTPVGSAARNCIIVVQVDGVADIRRLVGIIVDNVEEVVAISAADIEPTPDFGVNTGTQSILGMAKVRNTVKTLLNIDNVLNGDASSEFKANSQLEQSPSPKTTLQP